MKLKNILLGALAFIAASCEQYESPSEFVISTDKAVYEIGSAGGEVSVKLVSATDWTVSVDPATSLDDVKGITVEPSSGKASLKPVEVKIIAEANGGFDRAALISFLGENISTAVKLNQKGTKERPAEKLTVAEFLAKPVDASIFYTLTGTVKGLRADDKYSNCTLVDETGEIYIYGVRLEKGGSNNVSALQTKGVVNGDILTIETTRGAYNSTPQGNDAYYISHEKGSAPPVVKPDTEGAGTLESPYTVADVKAIVAAGAYDAEKVYVAGIISGLKNQPSSYGNLDYWISADGTTTDQILVYRGKHIGGANITEENLMKVGDKVVVLGALDEYKGDPQIGQGNEIVTIESTPSEDDEVTVEGKQWLGNVEGMDVLVDLGASEEGVLVVALPAEDESGFVVYAYGPYVLSATDETSGTIVAELLDLEADEEWTESFLYSELAETTVKIASEGGFLGEEPVAFTKASEYIEFTVPGEGGGGDVTENSIPNGEYWIVNDGKAATPVAKNKSYDYLGAEDMIDGASYAKNAFTFTYNADETRYTIQDSYGRYLYVQGSYNNFNVSATLPESGAYWSVEDRGDGTYDIYNGENGNSISFANGRWEQRNPDAENFSGIYPSLVKAENPVPEPEVDPTVLSYELGENADDTGLATINGEADTKTIKIGTSKKSGEFTLSIPAGTKKVNFYAVAWKGTKNPTIEITREGGSATSLPINANDGASGNPPYTITATDADKYSLETNNEAVLKVTVTSAARVIFWGITAE